MVFCYILDEPNRPQNVFLPIFSTSIACTKYNLRVEFASLDTKMLVDSGVLFPLKSLEAFSFGYLESQNPSFGFMFSVAWV